MQYLTITENTYEDAVRKARELYGDGIRIHSRRDYTTSGGLFTRKVKKCEITCYLPTNYEPSEGRKRDLNEFEKEARTPDPRTLTEQERLNTEIHRNGDSLLKTKAESLLDMNHIEGPFRERILSLVDTQSEEKVKRSLTEAIINNTLIDYQTQAHPDHAMVFIGPTGTGKTTTLAKVAHLAKRDGRRVAIISLDSYRVGAYEQIKAFGDALGVPVALCRAEDEVILALERFNWYDLVLVDTMGISNKDVELGLKLRGLLSQFKRVRTSFVFVSSPSMKEEDLTDHFERYKEYKPSSLIATKLDETETIGNILSFSYKVKLPLLFLTDGQKVPDDIEKASTSSVLDHLKGFGLDIPSSSSQIRRR